MKYQDWKKDGMIDVNALDKAIGICDSYNFTRDFIADALTRGYISSSGLNNLEMRAVLDYLYRNIKTENLSNKAKSAINKALDSFIKDRKKYEQQAKRGNAPTIARDNPEWWGSQVKKAEELKL